MGPDSEARPDCGPETGCITCGDEATRMRVLEVAADTGLALCAGPDGLAGEVDTVLVEPVTPGTEVLVHAGVALVRFDPSEVAAP